MCHIAFKKIYMCLKMTTSACTLYNFVSPFVRFGELLRSFRKEKSKIDQFVQMCLLISAFTVHAVIKMPFHVTLVINWLNFFKTISIRGFETEVLPEI